MGWAIPFCYGDRLLETHRSELCIHSKIAASLSIRRSLLIKMKKLLYDSVDRLLYSEGAEKSDSSGISGRSCGFRPPIAGFCQWVGQHRHLARRLCGPLGPEDISWQKMHLWQIPRPLTQPDPLYCRQNTWFQQIGCHICWTWTRWTLLSSTFCSRKSRQCLMPILTP